MLRGHVQRRVDHVSTATGPTTLISSTYPIIVSRPLTVPADSKRLRLVDDEEVDDRTGILDALAEAGIAALADTDYQGAGPMALP